MREDITDVFGFAEALAQRTRANGTSRRMASELAGSIATLVISPGEYVLVHGESGIPNFFVVAHRLVDGGFKNDLNAWMNAGVLACGVAAAHEMRTGVPVTEAMQLELRNHLTDFALSSE